ncbi:MAG: FAD-binding domain-containing protein, partial [Chlamydiota bacterium]
DRDFPSLECTSKLSPHLHFGEISPRQVVYAAQKNAKFLSEVGWREFSYYQLSHFPDLPEKSWRPEFVHFPWKNNAHFLEKWQQGQTGYPIVDAGMRELKKTGIMHNRVRMIAASFLIKDLFIPWQTGADWFWQTLVDADLASNSSSWQWVAGCGFDAAPFFRVFNPILQSKKFDPEGLYIKQFVPELAHLSKTFIHEPWDKAPDYPKPLVNHEEARKKALEAFKMLRTGPL